jgi:hypothetical protein
VHLLDTGDRHRVHVEQHGHPQGRPVLLHGKADPARIPP